MKIKNIIIAGILILGTLTTSAQTIAVNETSASANGVMEMNVVANGDISKYIATGFYIELPEGFSVAGVESIKSDAVQSDHVIKVGQTESNKLRVAIYSLNNSTLNLNSPLSLCTLKIKAPNKIGTFNGNLSGVEFATNSHSLVTAAASTFIIKLSGKGDVNGDGSINAKDIVDLVMYMMGKKALDLDAADVNGDGVVNSADVVIISNVILSEQ